MIVDIKDNKFLTKLYKYFSLIAIHTQKLFSLSLNIITDISFKFTLLILISTNNISFLELFFVSHDGNLLAIIFLISVFKSDGVGQHSYDLFSFIAFLFFLLRIFFKIFFLFRMCRRVLKFSLIFILHAVVCVYIVFLKSQDKD